MFTDMDLILKLPVLLFSVVVHEYCHGYVALRRGDDTARLSGRLTFNPLPHLDPIGSVLVPVVLAMSGAPIFAWAKPVPVMVHNLDNPRRDLVLVSLAGPLSNIGLSFLSAVFFRLTVLATFLGPGMQVTLAGMFLFSVYLNLYLALFNLIPVYPLDGSRILAGFLEGSRLATYESHAPYGGFILIALLMTGVLGWVIGPGVMLFMGIMRLAGLL